MLRNICYSLFGDFNELPNFTDRANNNDIEDWKSGDGPNFSSSAGPEPDDDNDSESTKVSHLENKIVSLESTIEDMVRKHEEEKKVFL